jgi:hypothetical protein
MAEVVYIKTAGGLRGWRLWMSLPTLLDHVGAVNGGCALVAEAA